LVQEQEGLRSLSAKAIAAGARFITADHSVRRFC
jgi:hypothetical protein